jgi:exosome complex exonuclease RRP6
MKRANIIKPQNAFERKVDNFDTGPWKPLLTTKPHATLPLDKSLTTFVDGDDTTQYDHLIFLPLSVYSSIYMRQCVSEGVQMESKKRKVKTRSGHYQDTNSKSRYKHPYETEIMNLSYPKRIYEKKDAIPYLPFESTTATWVDTYEGVLEMLGELRKAKEIAVDLEHHDFRTYPGLTSLMQISTREKDWVVDTLRPWRHKLEVLNEVFADPGIIKVHIHSACCTIRLLT